MCVVFSHAGTRSQESMDAERLRLRALALRSDERLRPLSAEQRLGGASCEMTVCVQGVTDLRVHGVFCIAGAVWMCKVQGGVQEEISVFEICVAEFER